MEKGVNTSHADSVTASDVRLLMNEAYEELNEFKATKQTVADLLNYKRSLIDLENSDFEKINEIKGKAINAINNLFNDIMNTR